VTASTTRCPTCGRRHKRTTAANAYYWQLLHAIAEGVRPGGNAYGPEAWHVYAKSRWLGADDVKLPNGKVIVVPHSTANLSVDEFNDYVSAVEAWAAERGVFLEMAA